MMRQTMPNIRPAADWLRYNADGDHSVDDFGVLDELETCRQPDGTFQFKLLWPQKDLTADNSDYVAHTGGGGHNTQEWKQSSNPAVPARWGTGVTGYEPIEIHYDSFYWCGLEYLLRPTCICHASEIQTGWSPHSERSFER
jgi:hypothetical protein